MPDRVNHLAVWVSAIVYFLFGAVWYTITGPTWLAFLGKTKESLPNSPTLYIASFVLGLILAYATAIALTRHPEDQSVAQGVSFALFMGIAVYATQTLNHVIFEGRSIGLWVLNTAYTIIGFAIVGAIVGGWKRRVTGTISA
jgi:ABC-type Mn2+/Zn2+ transport system permease subunit